MECLVYGVTQEVQVFLIIMKREDAHWAFGIGKKNIRKQNINAMHAVQLMAGGVKKDLQVGGYAQNVIRRQ